MRLNLVVLRVADLDRAEAFYGALGIAFERHRHGKGPEHRAAELPGGCVFELYPAGNAGSSSGTRIGFAVASVDAAFAALLDAGGEPVTPPSDSLWGRQAVVADPDGHRVELT
jgi:catechol 2,3-dioxygenase-like lactoylglutathione lyase family enzyme